MPRTRSTWIIIVIGIVLVVVGVLVLVFLSARVAEGEKTHSNEEEGSSSFQVSITQPYEQQTIPSSTVPVSIVARGLSDDLPRYVRLRLVGNTYQTERSVDISGGQGMMVFTNVPDDSYSLSALPVSSNEESDFDRVVSRHFVVRSKGVSETFDAGQRVPAGTMEDGEEVFIEFDTP